MAAEKAVMTHARMVDSSLDSFVHLLPPWQSHSRLYGRSPWGPWLWYQSLVSEACELL